MQLRCARYVRVPLAVAVAIAMPRWCEAQGALSDEQVAAAIKVGQQGRDLSVRVGTTSGRGAVCTVVIEGPAARIAAASAAATRGYRPFTRSDVTDAMRAMNYVVSLRGSALACPGHVVLQPLGATGLEGVIQPISEGSREATFDHLPAGEFQVIVADQSRAPSKIAVSASDRAKLDVAVELGAAATPSTPTAVREKTVVPVSADTASRRMLRVVVNGYGKHVADAIAALRAELQGAGVSLNVVQTDEPWDYRIVFAEGDRNAASAIAVDGRSNVAAVSVRAGFTEKGASEAAARDLAKKIAAFLP